MTSGPAFLLTRLLLPLTLLGCSVSNAYAATETAQEYAARVIANQDQLLQLDKAVEQSEKQRELLKKQLQQSERLVSGRVKRIEQLSGDIRKFESRLADFERSVANLHESLDLDRIQLAQMLRDSQRAASAAGLKLVLNQQDPSLSGRLGLYIDRVMQVQQKRIAYHAMRLEKMHAARSEALKSRNWLQHIQKKARQQQQTFTQSAQKSSASLQLATDDVKSGRDLINQLKAEQQQLQELIQELQEKEANRSGYFASLKGRLPWPVDKRTGKLKLHARFGDIKSSGKLSWNGLLIKSKAGQDVLAIADGEAVFADKLAGLGSLVVLDHGDGYMSLYGGNREVLVKSGAWVESGATIATVGRNGGPNPEGIYLEIRHNAIPINPEQWLVSANSATIANK